MQIISIVVIAMREKPHRSRHFAVEPGFSTGRNGEISQELAVKPNQGTTPRKNRSRHFAEKPGFSSGETEKSPEN